MTRIIRLYGLSEEALRERLGDLLVADDIEVTLCVCEGQGTLTLTAEESLLEDVTQEVAMRLGDYVYSYEGESLAHLVVKGLSDLGLTLSTAESCTGGLIAAALTDVPGASRVFGTGVVSYSNECKQALLSVAGETLTAYGAVSADTAGQMARGVRQTGHASIGVSVTGEAGPNPSEHHPVGTVFIALADKKRTWVEELHLEGDRGAIRRQAADRVLWLVWRYLTAYPAVMAGGESHLQAGLRQIPRTQGQQHPRLLARLLPWRGDSLRRKAVKCAAWLGAASLLVGGVLGSYYLLVEPNRNRQLQNSLGDLYYESTDLTEGVEDTEEYPKGMLPVFRGLYEKNEDVAGWIHVSGTNIDYPVMQYADGYYRSHNFEGLYSLYGQPYFDKQMTISPDGGMMVIYGRNTEDGQMFSELLNYRRVAYLREHSFIEMNTLYETARWQVCGVMVLDRTDTKTFTIAEEPKDYDEFLSAVAQRSLFTTDLALTPSDRLLLLAVDAEEAYGFAGAQLVVVARQVRDETAQMTYRVNYQAVMPTAMTEEKTSPTAKK